MSGELDEQKYRYVQTFSAPKASLLLRVSFELLNVGNREAPGPAADNTGEMF